MKKKAVKKKSSYEGLQKNVRRMKTPAIEVWENRYQDRDYTIVVETDEFSCICPKTGLPDFANIRIAYVPDRHCIELKSFKLYLGSYRHVGIFHEHVANRIFDDFIRAADPRSATIDTEFNLRGGIKTSVHREFVRDA